MVSHLSFLHLARSTYPMHLDASGSCRIAAKVAAFRTDMGKEYAVKKAWYSVHDRLVF